MTDQPIPMTPRPDAELGHALERFDPPALGAGFWQTLTDRLAAEPDIVAPPERRRRPWLRLAAVAAAAAFVVVPFLWVGLPGDQGDTVVPGPEPATAAERMVAKMTYAMSNARNLSGKLHATMRGDGLVIDSSFATTSDGDYRLEFTSAASDDPKSRELGGLLVYDAWEHRVSWTPDDDRERGIANSDAWGPGAPFPLYPAVPAAADLAAPATYQQFGSLVKSLVADGGGDVSVEERTYEGRPVWVATLPVSDLATTLATEGSEQATPAADGPDATVEITVDRETGLLLRFKRVPADGAKSGPAPFELRLSDLVTDAELPDRLFDVETGGEIAGFSTFGTVPDAAAAAGYEPLLPQWTPPGFALSGASWTTWTNASPMDWVAIPMLRLGGTGLPAQVGQQDQPSIPGRTVEVDLAYRRGLDWFIVRQMPTGAVTAESAPIAMLVEDPALRWGHRRQLLGSGALAGEAAHTWLLDAAGAAGPVPAMAAGGSSLLVWGEDPADPSVLITGSLTRKELLGVAESLQPAQD